MCVFCKQRSLSQEHSDDTLAPEAFGTLLPATSLPIPLAVGTGLQPDTIRLVVNNDDSAPDSIDTTNSMDVGDTFAGEIDYDFDEDWIAIDLVAGQSIQIDMSGLDDNRIGFYRPGGGLVTLLQEDQLIQEITETGTHFIKVESIFSINRTGSYAVTVTDVSPFPAVLSAPMESIDWGSEVADSTISYYFAPAGFFYSDPFDTVTGEAWNAYEQAQMRKALDRIEEVIDVTFVETSSEETADFTLIADADGDIDNLGFFNPPGEDQAGTGVFNVGLWDRSAGGDLEEGGLGFVTITHELLHGLGLAHPHDRGGTSSRMSGVTEDFDDTGTYLLNQGLFTTMSYNEGYFEGPVGTRSVSQDYGQEFGPMALDIAVLQRKYGANESTGAGDDIYDLPDANAQGSYYMAIWDTGGTDTLRYTGARDSTLDLRTATLENAEGGGGYVSAAQSIAGGYTIAYGVVIENAESGDGADRLQGNAANNHLSAGAGNDTVLADLGDDTVIAGAGADKVEGRDGHDLLVGEGGSDTLSGGNDNDTLNGGSGADQLRGQKGADLIDGGNGTDNIKGGGSGDEMRGGNGSDTLNGGGGNDEMRGGNGHDSLKGGGGDDMLRGSKGRDTLNAGSGEDRLIGGEEDDQMKGGAGADVFVFDLGMDADRLLDLDLGEDRLEITAALAGGRDAAALEDLAEVVGNGVLLDFGNGDQILFSNLTSTDGLADVISIV